jgi:hypothetical protein
MKTRKKLLGYLILVLAVSVLGGCFPTVETHIMKKEDLKSNYIKVNSPSKVFLKDASMIIFQEGFTVSNNYLTGEGIKHKFAKSDLPADKTGFRICIDSLVAVTVNDLKLEGSRQTANTLLFAIGLPTTAISGYCVACPKCCFGSCPTVYSYDGTGYNFETELFSYSIAKQIEENDLDLLNQPVPENGILNLKVNNEALETHYINKLSLILANHPAGTKLLPSAKGKYVLIQKPIPPVKAINSEGKDVTSLINSPDANYYRSNTEMVKKLRAGINYDWLDIKTKVPDNSKSAKLILRYKNTLLSTVLFYEVVLGSQGIKAVNWTNNMNNDKLYASQFNFVYQTFSGLIIFENKNGSLKGKGAFADAGPLSWKYSAEEFSIDGENELNIRLKFIPDNFMIDYAAFDFSDDSGNSITYQEIAPYEITDIDNSPQNDIPELINNADNKYIVTNPGDSYKINYKIIKRYDCEQTLFISSRGFYNEWIRGSWIRNNRPINSGYTFNLADINGTLENLADSWIYSREEIEREFFKNKIPIRGTK